MLVAQRSAARWLGFCLAGSIAVFAQASGAGAPSPHPSGTTLVARPTHRAPGEIFHLTGEADCDLVFATLWYKDYNGRDQEAGGRDNHARWNERTQKSDYTIDVRAPVDAAPGEPASAYAEPLCGTPDEGYPPSNVVHLTIDPARPHLTVSPPGVRRGRTATIHGTGCYGSTTATVPVQVRWPGGGVDLRARRSADTFTTTVTVPTSARVGAGTVTMTDAADCPGSTLPASGGFQVVAAPVVTRSASPSLTTSPHPSATTSMATSPSSDATTPVPGTSLSGGPHAGAGSGRTTSPLLAAVVVLAGLAVLAAGLVTWRRRRVATGLG